MHTIHEGQKDFKCESCSKSFSHAGDLKKHLRRIHEGYKDHKCESCGKSFPQEGNLKKHICTVHEKDSIVQCSCCYIDTKNKNMYLS